MANGGGISRTHVHRDHAGGAALEQAVGEAPGGRANIERSGAGYIERQSVERSVELVSSPGHEPGKLADRHTGIFGQQLSGLVDALFTQVHVTGHQQRPSLRARRRKTEVEQKRISASLHASTPGLAAVRPLEMFAVSRLDRATSDFACPQTGCAAYQR